MAKKVAEIKTNPTGVSVTDFIGSVPSEQKRRDGYALLKLMEKITKEKGKMWGSSIIGFIDKRYKSPTSGREVDWFTVGFSPRKANLSLYFMDLGKHAEALKKLGKYKAGGGCIYINKLEDVDVKVLEKMIAVAIK